MRSTGGEYENEFVRTAGHPGRPAHQTSAEALRTKAATISRRAVRFATNAELRYDFDEWIATKGRDYGGYSQDFMRRSLERGDDDRAQGVRK